MVKTPQFQQQVSRDVMLTVFFLHPSDVSVAIYLKIVRLGACFHSRQRVYGRFGHFDLHHLSSAQGGGIHADMG